MQVRTLARSLVIVAAALALLAVLPVSGQSAETVKLKMADSFPTSHYVVSQAAKPWMDRVVQLSKTKVEFQYFPSEQLGKQSDMVNLLRTGVAEVVYTSPTGLSGDFPLHTFFFLPNLFGTCTEGTRIYQQMLKEGPLLEEFTKKGARPLFLFTIPTYEIFTVKKPPGGRNNAYMPRQEEEEFLRPFTERAPSGGIVEVQEIHKAFEARVGERVPKSTIYRLLHRHGWRKIIPRKKHPKSDPLAQEEVKKTHPSGT